MCLVTNKKKPSIAKKPIIVYKFFQKTRNEDTYQSPYLFYTYKFKKGDKIESEGLDNIELLEGYGQGKYMVGEGYLHAYQDIKSTGYFCRHDFYGQTIISLCQIYKDPDDLEDILKQFDRKMLNKYVLLEMEIPAGTLYYKGVNDGHDGKVKVICAKNLIYKHKVLEIDNIYDYLRLEMLIYKNWFNKHPEEKKRIESIISRYSKNQLTIGE